MMCLYCGIFIKVRSSVTQFHDISSLTLPEIADLLLTHELHILVDLMGFSTGGRHELLALKPAPLQIAYMGYPGVYCVCCSTFEYMLVLDNTHALSHILIQGPQVLPSLTMFSVTPPLAVQPQLRSSSLRRLSSCQNLTSLHQWYLPDHHRLHWMVRRRICSF